MKMKTENENMEHMEKYKTGKQKKTTKKKEKQRN